MRPRLEDDYINFDRFGRCSHRFIRGISMEALEAKYDRGSSMDSDTVHFVSILMVHLSEAHIILFHCFSKHG